jgi:Ion channel
MATAELPADASVWRRHTHPDGYAYGWLLVLILVSLAFQLASPESEWARVVTIALQSATLLAALHVSGAHPWLVRGASFAIVVAIAGTAGLYLARGEVGAVAARTVALMLVLLAPAAIAHGIARQARAAGAITVRTMFGVLCVYLLVGMAFGFAYGVVSAADDDDFFAQMAGGDQADFLYFSIATMTTTGFGDLTAATHLGRSLAVTEALVGQIYLVTVVALIVTNLTRTPARTAR